MKTRKTNFVTDAQFDAQVAELQAAFSSLYPQPNGFRRNAPSKSEIIRWAVAEQHARLSERKEEKEQ